MGTARISELLPAERAVENSGTQSIRQNRTPSEKYNFKMNGIVRNLTESEIDGYWKHVLVACMKKVAPDFVIDDRNRKLIAELYKWIWAKEGRCKPGMFDTGKGLLLWGPIGTGKTTLIKGIRQYYATINKLAYGYTNPGIGYEMRSAAEIALRYSSGGLSVLSKWTEKGIAGNLAIDEIGREEEAKYFGTPCNTIQTVLQLRYELRYDATTLGTTNMDMVKADEFRSRYGEYILDRVKEMFNIIAIEGKSRR